ncbi:MAG: hypothetical protein R3C11_00365 [Planctomycetaceae bacterium]
MRNSPTESVLSGIRQATFGPQNIEGWLVSAEGVQEGTLWVSGSSVTTVSDQVNFLRVRAFKLKQQNATDDQVNPVTAEELANSVPISNSPEIQKSLWRYRKRSHKTRPCRKTRLADPYFTRAAIWESLGHDANALDDYVTGLAYLRAAAGDKKVYLNHLERMTQIALRLKERPVPTADTEGLVTNKASKLFSRAYQYYFEGQIPESIDCLNAALQLAPDRPEYWIFRSLAYSRLGDYTKAQHDAVLGAHLEKRSNRDEKRYISSLLYRIQGERRIWIESFRMGNPL